MMRLKGCPWWFAQTPVYHCCNDHVGDGKKPLQWSLPTTFGMCRRLIHAIAKPSSLLINPNYNDGGQQVTNIASYVVIRNGMWKYTCRPFKSVIERSTPRTSKKKKKIQAISMYKERRHVNPMATISRC